MCTYFYLLKEREGGRDGGGQINVYLQKWRQLWMTIIKIAHILLPEDKSLRNRLSVYHLYLRADK